MRNSAASFDESAAVRSPLRNGWAAGDGVRAWKAGRGVVRAEVVRGGPFKRTARIHGCADKKRIDRIIFRTLIGR